MRAASLTPAARADIARLVAAPKFEILPLTGAFELAKLLPASATVAVTASPSKGLEATAALSQQLTAAGYQAVAHIAARMVKDRSHLRQLLARLAAGGVSRAFVVGGDAAQPGDYPDGLALLREMADLGHHFGEIGVPCYPQGHPDIPDDRLLTALEAKAPYADYMTTQLCFDAPAISGWITARRADGNTLPVDIGVAGVAQLTRLLRISMRIGVADARRFLSKNTGLIGRVLRPGAYRPDSLLERLAPIFGDPAAGVRQIHLYTFNQVETTEHWRHRYLRALRTIAEA
jgi:methylenetetrahydrofolate reductase (NADPH)